MRDKFADLTPEDLAIVQRGSLTRTLNPMRAGDVEDAITIAYLRSVRRMLPVRLNATERARVHDTYANQWRVAHGSYLAKLPRWRLPSFFHEQAE